jgi:hypothetical protein
MPENVPNQSTLSASAIEIMNEPSSVLLFILNFLHTKSIMSKE